MATTRKSVKVTLDAGLVREARALGVNLSRAAQEEIARAVTAEKERRWLEENAGANAASNRHVEKQGLPLASHRLFAIGEE